MRFALSFLAALVTGLSGFGASVRAKPNVVLFLVDDLGYGDLACHGNRLAQTPQIDAFAREAVALERFYVSPVCAPTRASLLTGRYNFRTGVSDVFGKAAQMDPAEVTIAEALRGAGYATGVFGKWHLGDEGPQVPNAQGFDEALVHPGAVLRQYQDPELLQNGAKRKFEGYCLDIFTDHAIDFIRRHRTRPFFLYLPPNLIHVPLQIADELTAPFRAQGASPSTAKIYAMLQNVDRNFGRLRAALAELGLEDNTLLVFTSDNGPCSSSVPVDRHMAGLHGLKGTVYENGIRVPTYVRWPAGFRSPARVDRLAAHLDVLPTVLDACGVPPPSGVALDGRSVLPLLRDPAAAWADRTIFLQWDSGEAPRRGHAFAAVSQRWKLVQPCGMDSPRQQHIRDRYAELCRLQSRGTRTIEGPPRLELYDLMADAGETKDLASTHPERVAAMRGEYDRWFGGVATRWKAAPTP
jgi:arylsulfatase A